MKFLYYLSLVSGIAPIVFAFRTKGKLMKDIIIAKWYFVFTFLVDITGMLLGEFRLNNEWLYNTYSLVEGLVMLTLIAKWFNSSTANLVILFFGLIFIIDWVYATYFFNSIISFSSQDKVLKGVLLITLSGILLIRLSTSDNIVLSEDYRFWFLIGIITYFSITLLVFATATTVLEGSKEAMAYSWIFHVIITIIANLIFAYSFTCLNLKKLSYTS